MWHAAPQRFTESERRKDLFALVLDRRGLEAGRVGRRARLAQAQWPDLQNRRPADPTQQLCVMYWRHRFRVSGCRGPTVVLRSVQCPWRSCAGACGRCPDPRETAPSWHGRRSAETVCASLVAGPRRSPGPAGAPPPREASGWAGCPITQPGWSVRPRTRTRTSARRPPGAC